MKLKQIIIFIGLVSLMVCRRNVLVELAPNDRGRPLTTDQIAYYTNICNQFTEPTSLAKSFKVALFRKDLTNSDYFFCQNQAPEKFLSNEKVIACLIYFGDDSFLIISLIDKEKPMKYKFPAYIKINELYFCSRLFTGILPTLESWFDRMYTGSIEFLDEIEKELHFEYYTLKTKLKLGVHKNVRSINELIRTRHYLLAEANINTLLTSLLEPFDYVVQHANNTNIVEDMEKYKLVRIRYIRLYRHIFNYLNENLVIIYLVKRRKIKLASTLKGSIQTAIKDYSNIEEGFKLKYSKASPLFMKKEETFFKRMIIGLNLIYEMKEEESKKELAKAASYINTPTEAFIKLVNKCVSNDLYTDGGSLPPAMFQRSDSLSEEETFKITTSDNITTTLANSDDNGRLKKSLSKTIEDIVPEELESESYGEWVKPIQFGNESTSLKASKRRIRKRHY
jgi:hypothetical protein